MRITCSEFRANFGRYLDLTLTEPVIITNFARDQGVLISAEVFHALRGRSAGKAHKAQSESITISITEFQRGYAHYQEAAVNNAIIITTHVREKTVLLSPETFDALFAGSFPKDLLAAIANTPQKITTSEFQKRKGHYLSIARRRPIILKKYGREKNALVSIETFRDLQRGLPKSEPLHIPIIVTASDLARNAGQYQDLSISQPVIITVNEQEQNALIAADVFKQRMSKDNSIPISHAHTGGLPPEELRDKYTYSNALYPYLRSPAKS